MRKEMTRLLRFIVVLAFVLAMVPAMALAVMAEDNGSIADVSGDKTANPSELSATERITTVELSLPSAEQVSVADIVFVMDKSTSTFNSSIDFSESVLTLLEELDNKDVKVKVGVVKFRGRASDALESAGSLLEYKEDNKGTIKTAINAVPSGSGTNIHGGLSLADSILSEDTDVPDENKFVILLTDGKSYIWNDAEGEPTCYYMQWYKHYAIQKGGVPALDQSAGQDKAPYPTNVEKEKVFKVGYGGEGDYTALYNSTFADLTGDSGFEQPCKYADSALNLPTGTVVARNTTNGAELFPALYAAYQKYYEFTPDAAWADMKYMEANPYEVIKNDDGTYTFDATKVNPNFYQYHADGLQKGLYKAGHLWTEMAEKYNCASVVGGNWNAASLELSKSFCGWLRDNSLYSAGVTDTAEVAELFNSIKNDIVYLVDSGIVTDVIHEDFELVKENGVSPFVVSVGDEILTATGDGPWNFGTAEEGKYPYVVSFDEATGNITWTINAPVENAKPAKLSYDLKLKVEKAIEGEHDTNESAVLAYTSTDEETGNFEFAKPKVNFIPELISISGKHIWDDKDNRDGKRPASVDIAVLAGNVEIASVTLDGVADETGEPEPWKYAFNNLPKYVPNADKTDFVLAKYSIKGRVDEPYEVAPITQPEMTESVNEYVVDVTSVYEPYSDISDFVPGSDNNKPSTPAAPQATDRLVPLTGDMTGIYTWALVLILSVAAAAVIISRKRRSN